MASAKVPDSRHRIGAMAQLAARPQNHHRNRFYAISEKSLSTAVAAAVRSRNNVDFCPSDMPLMGLEKG